MAEEPQKASCCDGGSVSAYSHTFAQAIPTARVKEPATVAEIAEPATTPPGTNFNRLVTAYRPAIVAPPVRTKDPATASARDRRGGNPYAAEMREIIVT